MTDNEIIKALKCCMSDKPCCTTECPFYKNACDNDIHALEKYALDLINRQKEEIERLRSMNQAKLDMIHDLQADLETAKAEAVKEFAERLDKEFSGVGMCNFGCVHNKIRRILKEMVGEDK